MGGIAGVQAGTKAAGCACRGLWPLIWALSPTRVGWHGGGCELLSRAMVIGCSGVGTRGRSVWRYVARAWGTWLKGWRPGFRGGGVASLVGLLQCAALFCPPMGHFNFHGPETWGGQSVRSGGWRTMRTRVTRRSIPRQGERGGGLGCRVFGWCFNSVLCVKSAPLGPLRVLCRRRERTCSSPSGTALGVLSVSVSDSLSLRPMDRLAFGGGLGGPLSFSALSSSCISN